MRTSHVTSKDAPLLVSEEAWRAVVLDPKIEKRSRTIKVPGSPARGGVNGILERQRFV